MITQKKIKEVMKYESETGNFIWIRPVHRKCIGQVAGSLKMRGEIEIKISGKAYSAHRLVWLYLFGYLPVEYIDHINGNRADNRIVNLRVATNSQNQANRGLHSTNTSGFRGVCWNKKSSKWQAGIKVKGKSFHLGMFENPTDASNAYKAAAEKYFGEYSEHLRAA